MCRNATVIKSSFLQESPYGERHDRARWMNLVQPVHDVNFKLKRFIQLRYAKFCARERRAYHGEKW
eukprot:617244-Hanusia_phi.AAC.1